MITEENILKHEWVGLNIEIIDSCNKTHKGIKGKIIDETKKMIVILTEKGIKKIPKKEIIFKLYLPHNETKIIKGVNVVFSPEERVKKVKNK